ncbi:MAG: serine acetyltransferase [Muribaculaceae bacterium]|nr:serine acetyltransferase [Muribaculaceae bacterium]MDE6009473.1 serine acetyltransferase [Muribaculaceae bacterium]MDE6793488.1 serine acetyltransferase [Muribaculaceae bacterium]
MTDKIEATILANIQRLSQALEEEKKMITSTDGAFPSVEGLKEVIRFANNIFFPDLFDKRRNGCEIRSFYIGVAVEKLYSTLSKEIARALMFGTEIREEEAFRRGKELAAAFIDTMPEIKRLLYTDVQAMYQNDPAVDNCGEVILCYPVVRAMVHYRVAHSLFKLNIPVLPRILTELAHSATGIDIHPGAEIGEFFAIDHGTGVVIGETCIIGHHVTLYQGVTLGAKNFTLDSNGHPINVPRHPILEDYVTVYSNASVLGRITVGRGSIIGGNVWLTNSVPAESRILQRKPMATTFIDGLGI